ncbi:DUF3265 domain-containing protein [Vibrio fluvialis]|nr:DUF3265 domain-containing protein [Vibrio fluvialis]MBY7919701.1 DUF3265 domain-containing protein [Vibrio fluvialis]MBY8273868.1 DUF3265 domain-containing protein [Vibrio fluvialis]
MDSTSAISRKVHQFQILVRFIGNSFITNDLRVIQHAWNFYYALVSVNKAVCGNIGIACLTP